MNYFLIILTGCKILKVNSQDMRDDFSDPGVMDFLVGSRMSMKKGPKWPSLLPRNSFKVLSLIMLLNTTQNISVPLLDGLLEMSL